MRDARRTTSALLAAMMLAALVLRSSPACAEPPELERKYRAALDHRSRGEDAAALAIYREIEASAPTGRSIAQVALAEQATGAWVAAERDMLVAFTRGGEWVTQNRAALESALTTIRRHLGSLEIVCDGCTPEADAQVFIDGVLGGRLPRTEPMRLELGKHRVEVRATNAFDVARDIEVSAGKLVREHIVLVRNGGPAAPSSASPSGPPTPPAGTPPPREPVTALSTDATPAAPARSTTATVLAASAFGLAAVSAGAAVVLGIGSNDAANEYNADAACDDANKPSRCTDLRDRAETQRTFAIVGGIAGAALAGAGLAIWLGSAPSSPKVTVSPRQVGVIVRF